MFDEREMALDVRRPLRCECLPFTADDCEGRCEAAGTAVRPMHGWCAVVRAGRRVPISWGIREGVRVTVQALPFGLLGQLLDGALDLDPETRRALAGLSGKVVDLEITGAGTIRLRIDGECIRVEPRDETTDADVTIRGAPISLLRFAFAGDRETLILGDEVSLHGDIALATRLQQIAARVDIDIEEALAQRFGDIPAHELMRGMRGLGGWMRAAGTALLADVSEYLRYEAAVTPRREDAERFALAVDDLRDDVERLDARVTRLERRRIPRQ